MRAWMLAVSCGALSSLVMTPVRGADPDRPRPTTIAGDVYLGPGFANALGAQYGVAVTLRHHFVELGVDARESTEPSLFGGGREVRDVDALLGLVHTRDDFVVFELLAETGSRDSSRPSSATHGSPVVASA
jgi:hypothetical protein